MSDRLVPVDELVTIDDIAQRFKMSLSVASDVVRGRDRRHSRKFPKPLTGRGTRAVWLWGEVAEWYEEEAPQARRKRQQAPRRKQSWKKSA